MPTLSMFDVGMKKAKAEDANTDSTTADPARNFIVVEENSGRKNRLCENDAWSKTKRRTSLRKIIHMSVETTKVQNIIFFLGELPFWSDMSIFWKAGAGAGVDLFLRYASCHKYRA